MRLALRTSTEAKEKSEKNRDEDFRLEKIPEVFFQLPLFRNQKNQNYILIQKTKINILNYILKSKSE